MTAARAASILCVFLVNGINFRYMEKRQPFYRVIIHLFSIEKSYLIEEAEEHKDGFNDELFRSSAQKQQCLFDARLKVYTIYSL